MGIKMARGQVIALVDDDAFWPATTVLPYLLAGLEDPKVGGVQGKQRYVIGGCQLFSTFLSASQMRTKLLRLIILHSAPTFQTIDARPPRSPLGK